MARGLVRRIFDYLDMPKGSVIVDPFGGVGTTGIEAASRGLQFIGCELEPKFVELAKQNFELHRRTWEAFGDPQPVIVQGDSRNLRQALAASATYGASVSSSALSADCVVGSPPFAGGCEGVMRADKFKDVAAFAEQQKNKGHGCSFEAKMAQLNRENDRAVYGQTPGQLGNMPAGSVDAVVSSPPYEGSQLQQSEDYWEKKIEKRPDLAYALRRHDGNKTIGSNAKGHVTSYGNIGAETGETFWTAARDIVTECHAILKPGGLAVWVCKDFVRKGQRVPFSDDWRKLCESCGFELVEWIHASLVKEERHPDLFGGDDIVKVTERKSFFRRLAEKKGSPPIDHEDVLVLRKG